MSALFQYFRRLITHWYFQTFLKQLYFRNDRRRESTFFIFAMFSGVSSYQQWLHSGYFRLLCLILCNMLCKIDAIGVTPIPAPIKIACSVFRASLDDVPNGPSRKHWKYTCNKLIGVRFMVFNTTFNNISAISWRWVVLLVVETGVSGEYGEANTYIPVDTLETIQFRKQHAFGKVMCEFHCINFSEELLCLDLESFYLLPVIWLY